MPKKIVQRECRADTSFSSQIPRLLQRVYAARGITSDAELNYSVHGLARYHQLKGIDKAAELITAAITSGKRILVIGDFDADGATSSALAVSALRAMAANDPGYLVPNRFEYGYGLSPEIVAAALPLQPDMLITVDNGISSIEGVKAAKAAGLQVVVTDHHLAGRELPDADAIVNPNQPGCDFASKNTAGVGIIFYVMCAVRTLLEQEGWFDNRSKPNMKSFLDLVALGTVADVVSLDNNNRTLVHIGMQIMRAQRCRPGIMALAEVAGRSLERLATSDLGFAMAPRLNAAGRLDDMSLGIELLLCQDINRARAMASELDSLNRERKEIEEGMKQQAIKALEKIQLEDGKQLPWSLCLYENDWHQGVIGIVASRIKERFHRPVIAFAPDDNGMMKGSARSIPGFHIRDALDAVATANPGLIPKFGGHAMAAGLSLAEKHLPKFTEAFEAEARAHLDEDALQSVLLTDGELTIEDFDLNLAQQLKNGGPWGQNFPEPCFDGTFRIVQQRIVGQHHLKMTLQPTGHDYWVDAIAFNVDTGIWPDPAIQRARVVYKLDVNHYRGNDNLQLLVDYLEPA
ncbi:single-stranded-DNA-specific exonuclease RecJ [Spongorhabdus nitratireducens]